MEDYSYPNPSYSSHSYPSYAFYENPYQNYVANSSQAYSFPPQFQNRDLALPFQNSAQRDVSNAFDLTQLHAPNTSQTSNQSLSFSPSQFAALEQALNGCNESTRANLQILEDCVTRIEEQLELYQRIRREIHVVSSFKGSELEELVEVGGAREEERELFSGAENEQGPCAKLSSNGKIKVNEFDLFENAVLLDCVGETAVVKEEQGLDVKAEKAAGNNKGTEFNNFFEKSVLLACAGADFREEELNGEVRTAAVRRKEVCKAEIELKMCGKVLSTSTESAAAAASKMAEFETQSAMEDELVLGERLAEMGADFKGKEELNRQHERSAIAQGGKLHKSEFDKGEKADFQFYYEKSVLLSIVGGVRSKKQELQGQETTAATQRLKGYNIDLVDELFDGEKEQEEMLLIAGQKRAEMAAQEQQVLSSTAIIKRVAETAIEDLTLEDFDMLLLEDNELEAEYQKLDEEVAFKAEKKDEKLLILQDSSRATEPKQEQVTFPCSNEGVVLKLENCVSLPLLFKLMDDVCFVVLNFNDICGERKQKQWMLLGGCKLKNAILCGEIYKKGAHGDDVLWSIKVHPP